MTAAEFTTLRFHVDGGVARITLDRPQAANALDLDMARDLQRAARWCEERAEVRAVILDARGIRFCVGGDLKSFLAAGAQVECLITKVTDAVHDAVLRFSRMNAPLITCVQGIAAGAGMGLALAGDIVLASPAAAFVPAYPAAGLSPDCGLSWLLPRLVGYRRAQHILLNNQSLSSADAQALGLVTAVVDPEHLDGTAIERARNFAEGPTAAYGTIKRLIGKAMSATLDAQLAAEGAGISRLAGSSDGQEGMRAFAEKRRPVFRGR